MLFGVGGVHQLDSYLSPLEYHGPQFHFMHETLRPTHLADSTVTFQTPVQGDFAYTKNKPERARALGGNISFDAAWHFHLINPQSSDHPLGPKGRLTLQESSFRLLLGPQMGTNMGFLYNTRNGNNPAQALVSVRLSASAMAIYDFRLWRQPLCARYQLDVPLLGLMFSPGYGQSYYEIFSLGHYDHNICVTHPFNAFSSRHLLSVEIPLRPFTLRAGYLCDIRQSHVNDIRHHSYTHAFMIGWVRYLTFLHQR